MSLKTLLPYANLPAVITTNFGRDIKGTRSPYIPGTLAVTQDSFTTLLLQGGGADQSTTFTDSSTYNKSGSSRTGANLVITSSFSKFGGSSIAFHIPYETSTAPALNYAGTSDFAFGTGAFTIDMWLYSYRNTSYNLIYSMGGHAHFGLLYTTGGKLALYEGGDVIVDSVAMPLETWFHFAWTGNGGGAGARTQKLFKDGTQIGSTYTYDYNYTYANPTSFGINQDAVDPWNSWWGYMDEVRISKGIERWTGNFTPPTVPY